jgi:hypothetical protein
LYANKTLRSRLVEPPIVGGAANTFCDSERVEGSVGEIDITTDAFHALVLDGSLHSLAAIADGDGPSLDNGLSRQRRVFPILSHLTYYTEADKHPKTRVTGIDLSPIQPIFVRPNLKYIVDDAEGDWVFHNSDKFDLIHARMMVGSFAGWPRFVEKAYIQLVPGGYLELKCSLANWWSLVGPRYRRCIKTQGENGEGWLCQC